MYYYDRLNNFRIDAFIMIKRKLYMVGILPHYSEKQNLISLLLVNSSRYCHKAS